MPKLLHFEFKRIFKSIFFWIICAYSFVWPLLTALFYRAMLSLDLSDGIKFNKLHLATGEIRFFTWMIAIAFITELPKFVALFCCLHLGRDYTDGIVRNKIIAGHSRASIYFSYLLTQIVASVIFCVIYIGGALFGVAVSGIGVDVNGGEMFARFGVGIVVFLVMTVTFSVLAVIFRKRALPIILCIFIAISSNAAATVIGMFNTPSKAYDDYIQTRNEKLEEMADDGILGKAFVNKVEREYGKDEMTGVGWKIFHPAYVISPIGYEADYKAGGITSLLAGGEIYVNELDYSSILYSDAGLDTIWENINYDKVKNADDIYISAETFKNVDSLHVSYNTLNWIYLGKSIAWMAVIGGWGFIIFRRKNLF